jgi:hypothetical protein
MFNQYSEILSILYRKHAAVKARYQPLLSSFIVMGVVAVLKNNRASHAQTPFQASKLGNVCAIAMRHFHDTCDTEVSKSTISV